ncbi:MAG: TIGR02186 family protein [Pseudolabrys sp.]|nr:TIGR02186 family protein [Pseudolabrys sp.]
MTRATILAVAIILLSVAPSKAERMVVSLSNHRVAVTSSFVGENLVLFGTIEPDSAGSERSGNYDIVVTVAGPPKTYRTRRKERVAGIWVNVDSREFIRVPAYLSILSNRTSSDIANIEVARRLQLGLDNFLLTQRVGSDFADTVRDDPFRAAFVHLETQSGFYSQRSTGVTFLTPSVFRANIPVPANAPVGNYAVDVKLFANGALIGQTTSAFEIIKTGFEQYVADAAANRGLLYGLATAMLALLTGWFASVVFRRD